MGGPLGDIGDLISAINQRGDADDIVNNAVANPDQAGSALQTWYSMHGTTQAPPGVQYMHDQYVAQKAANSGVSIPEAATQVALANNDSAGVLSGRAGQALAQVGQDVASRKITPYQALAQINTFAPSMAGSSDLINRQFNMNAANPSAAQPNTVATQAPNLASMGAVQTASVTPMLGSQGDTMPNAPAPSNVAGGGSYPALAASNGLLTGAPQTAAAPVAPTPVAPRTAAFMPPTAPQTALPANANAATNPTVQYLQNLQAQGGMSGSPVDTMMKIQEAEKNAADTASANATAAQKTAETPANVAKATADAEKTKSETVFAPSGAPISAAQQDEDKQFGPAWGTFKNQGGSDQVRIANEAIDDALNKLRTGKVTTGGPIDAMSTDAEGHPGLIGGILNRPLVATKTEVDSAISPLLKPLFGARVTNFEASNLQRSLGIDPYADTGLNIEKLVRLKDKINSGAAALNASGQYFDAHKGTLAEYPGNTSITQPNNPQPPQPPKAATAQRTFGTPDRAQALREQLARIQASKGR